MQFLLRAYYRRKVVANSSLAMVCVTSSHALLRLSSVRWRPASCSFASGTRRCPLVLSQANRGGGEAAGSPWWPASFWKSHFLVMAPVGRGGGDRLSSGGAASTPLGPTEKPVCNLSAAYVALHILFNQQNSPMQLCANMNKSLVCFLSHLVHRQINTQSSWLQKKWLHSMTILALLTDMVQADLSDDLFLKVRVTCVLDQDADVQLSPALMHSSLIYRCTVWHMRLKIVGKLYWTGKWD